MTDKITIKYSTGQMTFNSPNCLLDIDNQNLKKFVFKPIFDLPIDENKKSIETIKKYLMKAIDTVKNNNFDCEFFKHFLENSWHRYRHTAMEKFKSKIERVSRLFNTLLVKYGFKSPENKEETEMKKENGFKKGIFKTVYMDDGKLGLKEVSGYVVGDIGLDQRTKGNWRATHIPSGLAIGPFGFNTRQEALEESTVMLEKTEESILQKSIEQFQNLLKDFESEIAGPAEKPTVEKDTRTPKEIVEAWKKARRESKAAENAGQPHTKIT